MRLYKETYLRKKFSSILFTLFSRLENNNNADFITNGEERFVNDYFSSLRGPVTLFDVGGNIGGYSEILVEQCKKRKLEYSIHVFEPTQSCFGILLQKFSNDNEIHLNNVGASDSATKADIYYDTEQSGFASLYQRDLSSMNVTMNQKETITLTRLDTYIEERKIEKIDLLKIDIEGHELAAFRGLGSYLNSETIAAIQFEYGGANIDSKTTLREIYNLLENAGFVIAKIMKTGIEIRKYSSMIENYQYANYVALSKSLIPSHQ
ncbi:MAG: FkbM family methyltransferase [Bacteriovoracaceae bacterium]